MHLKYEMRLGSEDDDMHDIEFEVADKLGIQGKQGLSKVSWTDERMGQGKSWL